MAEAPAPTVLSIAAEPEESSGTELRTTGLSIDGGATFVDFDLDAIKDDEAIALEDAFDMPWVEFLRGFVSGRLKAYKAAVWIVLRRDNPTLTPDDMSFNATQLRVRNEEVPVPLSEAAETSAPT